MKSWESLTQAELTELVVLRGLSDEAVAELYGVSVPAVRARRRGWGLGKIRDENASAEPLWAQLNQSARERLLQAKNIPLLAAALARYGLEDGPAAQYPESERAALLQYAQNRLAAVLDAAFRGAFLQLELFCAYYREPTAQETEDDALFRELLEDSPAFRKDREGKDGADE